MRIAPAFLRPRVRCCFHTGAFFYFQFSSLLATAGKRPKNWSKT
nr:MAG TPA: hypothetical protein [Caudoviricetes sp.]